MFFVRQKSQECGLHAIQNMLKTAAINRKDIHEACETIEKETGDVLHHHESYCGDWSVNAVLKTLHNHGFTVDRAVRTQDNKRSWSVPEVDDLLKDESFRGFIVHQPMRHHFTCLRPEMVDGKPMLYYVDSQSRGPIRMSARLAMQRCLSAAYAWEPYLVRGDNLEFVSPEESPQQIYQGIAEEQTVEQEAKNQGIVLYRSVGTKRPREEFKPSEQFLRNWRLFSQSKTTIAPLPTESTSSQTWTASGGSEAPDT